MISKYGTGTVTQRDDVHPDAPLAKTASLTDIELAELANEEPVDEE